jgi:hypothetical protein
MIANVVPPKKGFPIPLLPKKKLKLSFVAKFGCVNDQETTTTLASHDDYRTFVTVAHDALDGIPDSHPACDVCPRGPLPGGIDPNPDGTLKDKGCGNKDKSTGQLGADVTTDVFIKQ